MIEMKIVNGQTWHGRRGGIKNDFKYSIDYLLFDPDNLGGSPWLLSKKGGWFYGINQLDYGSLNDSGAPKKWVNKILENRQIKGVCKILLLAQPRILGHVFNPVSFWLCFNDQDQLVVVLAEVSNTFGDRHSYLCYNSGLRPIQPKDRLKAVKIFHVSPFQSIEGNYEFRFDIDVNKKIGIWIDLQFPGGGVLANLTGSTRKLKNIDILWSLIRRPLGSRRALALIHWQALKLFLKGARYRKRPSPPDIEVS